MPIENHQVRLAGRPRGLPTPDVWEHTVEAIGDPGPGAAGPVHTGLCSDPAELLDRLFARLVL
ncbi:MAG: DUF3037 domain-containing protein [Actinomycetota bacterium]|nr:DUF3037 domain-containing protein [Actinomycetota bacterium]